MVSSLVATAYSKVVLPSLSIAALLALLFNNNLIISKFLNCKANIKGVTPLSLVISILAFFK